MVLSTAATLTWSDKQPRCNAVGAFYRTFRRLAELATGSAAGARAPKACVPRLRDVYRTGRVSRTERRISSACRRGSYLDAVLTLPVIRRQEGTAQDIRGTPTPHPAGEEAWTQAPHKRELLADQQPDPRLPLAGPLPTAPTWQIHAWRILLGHGYAG